MMHSYNLRARWSTICWLIGFVLLNVLLWLVLFRYNGYIFFWDLSGGFPLENSYLQYFFTYSPYDGVDIALKQRAPIMMVVFIIQKVCEMFGASSIGLPIKIVLWIMFAGTYTSFFIFGQKIANLFRISLDNSFKTQFLWMILSLLSLLIPFYLYRIVHLHLFLFPMFYPVFIYIVIALLTRKALSLKLWSVIALFLFFGITTPHAILYFVVTFIVLLGMLFLRREAVSLSQIIRRLAMFIFLAVILNFHWLLLFVSTPIVAPNYTVNESMMDLLTQNLSFFSFFTDTGDWFIAGKELSPLAENSLMQILQILGLYLYISFILFAIKAYRKNVVALSGVIITILVFLSTVPEMPIFHYITTRLVYFDAGWLLREVYRLKFLSSFWMFFLFALGTFTILRTQWTNNRYDLFVSRIIAFTAILLFIAWNLPLSVKIFQYIRPQVVPSGLIDVNNALSKEHYGMVAYLPESSQNNVEWLKTAFPGVDAANRDAIQYALSKPPIHESSSLPNPKSFKERYMYALFGEQSDSIAGKLAQSGIGYFIVEKSSQAPYSMLTSSLQTDAMFQFLHDEANAKVLYDNEHFSLYKLHTYKESFIEKAQHVQEAKLELSTHPDDVFIIDSLSGEYSKESGWNKASLKDPINYEFSQIALRYLPIAPFSREFDGILYSYVADVPEEPYYASTRLELDPQCRRDCDIWAAVLFSPRGGSLSFTVNGETMLLSLREEATEIRWVKLFHGMSFKPGDSAPLTLANEKGFSAITAFAFDASGSFAQQANMATYETEVASPSCYIQERSLFKSIQTFAVTTYCNTPTQLVNSVFESEFLVFDIKTLHFSFANEISVPEGVNSHVVFFVGRKDIALWALLLVESILLVGFCLYVFRPFFANFIPGKMRGKLNSR